MLEQRRAGLRSFGRDDSQQVALDFRFHVDPMKDRLTIDATTRHVLNLLAVGEALESQAHQPYGILLGALQT